MEIKTKKDLINALIEKSVKKKEETSEFLTSLIVMHTKGGEKCSVFSEVIYYYLRDFLKIRQNYFSNLYCCELNKKYFLNKRDIYYILFKIHYKSDHYYCREIVDTFYKYTIESDVHLYKLDFIDE